MVTHTSNDTVETARDIARSDAVKRMARLGLATRATLYLLIGWLALLIAHGRPNHEADQRGALEEVAHHQGGFLLLTVIAVGFTSYAFWRLTEFAFGTIGDGRGWMARLKSLARAVIYGGLAAVSLQVLVHTRVASQAQQQQQIASKVMNHGWGRLAVGVAGAIVAAVGLMMVVEGIRRKFKKYFDFAAMSRRVRRIVWVLGTIGTTARGLVFTITGILVIRAALKYDPRQSRGLDLALRSVAHAPHGQLLLTLLAAGLVVFALYGFAEAFWRRT